MINADSHGADGAGFPVSSRISGGVFFDAVVQGRDITVQLSPQITPALSGLPPASATFTGRDQHVEELLALLAPAEGRQQAVLAAVVGLAGIGKTELVVQTATRAVREPGWFPGGVLFVDMLGYDPERRLSPERALHGLLQALGMPSEHIPADLHDRARLYRSVLAAYAEQDRRILVVIDNASTTEQAHPLLPTDGTAAALLTSRDTLDLDARLYELDTLTTPASINLLRRVLAHTRGPADTRVADAPEDAAAIAQLCAGLPLALRITAALLADAPARPLTSLAQALDTAHTRLDRLRREDRAVHAAFDLSYQRLDHDHARLFRLLPLNVGTDISTETTAHLADIEQPRAEELLQDLARAHLVEPAPTWGRWRLHDLVRLYADQQGRTHADADQRTTAQTRLHDHYRTTAQAADTHLDTLPSSPSPRFTDRHHALAWLDNERLNLIAIAIAPPPFGHPDTTTSLVFALARYFDHRRDYNGWIAVITTALPILHELGDHHGEARARTDLDTARQGLYQEAITHIGAARGELRDVADILRWAIAEADELVDMAENLRRTVADDTDPLEGPG